VRPLCLAAAEWAENLGDPRQTDPDSRAGRHREARYWQAFGIANLVRVLGPLDLDDLVSSPEVPPEERDELLREGLPYRKTYAYVFTSPQWFDHPMPYRHPNGAVTWVRLPDLDLDGVKYVAPSESELA